ncbi:MAG: MFS transporter [Aristaeellaceae bacterium]
MAHAGKLRPFGLRDKVGYLFGDFGNDFTFILATMILMKFYTDVIGISAGVIGTVMMVTRFIDAFTDVTMGRIVDRLPPGRDGKFRRWLRWACVPVAVASFLLYQPGVAAWPYATRVAYLMVVYVLWSSVCYTAINIPYGSMASAISPEPGDRQSLSTYRSMGASLASTVIGIVLPLMAYEKLNGVETLIGTRVMVAAGIFSVLAVVCYLICYALTLERVDMAEKQQAQAHSSVGQMLRNALGNRALLSLIAASVVMLLAQMMMQNMAGYVYPDYYNSAAAQSISTGLMLGGMAVAALTAKPLAARFGKAEVSVVSNLFAAAVSVLTYFLRPQQVGVFIALQGLGWFGLGIFSMVSWALVTDVIDDAELRSGVREDGTVYALYSFARKVGQAAAVGMTGAMLSAIGYVPGAYGGQTEAVREGIFSIATLVPGIGFALLAAVLWFWYPLHKRQVEHNVAALKRKHE